MAYDSVLINDIDNDWENANNWDGGVPATGETIRGATTRCATRIQPGPGYGRVTERSGCSYLTR